MGNGVVTTLRPDARTSLRALGAAITHRLTRQAFARVAAAKTWSTARRELHVAPMGCHALRARAATFPSQAGAHWTSKLKDVINQCSIWTVPNIDRDSNL